MTEVTRMRWLVFQLFFLFSCINYILAKVESFKKDAIRLGVSGSRGLWVSGVSGVSGSPGSRVSVSGSRGGFEANDSRLSFQDDRLYYIVIPRLNSGVFRSGSGSAKKRLHREKVKTPHSTRT